MTDEMSPFEKLVEQHSDAELEQMAEEAGGLPQLFMQIAEKAYIAPVIAKVKEELRERFVYGRISPEAEDFFLDARANYLVREEAPISQFQRDDRLGETMDIIMALFDITSPVELPYSKNPRLEILQSKLEQDESLADLLVRTESDYMKVLIYHCNIRTIEELSQLTAGYREHQNLIRENKGRRPSSWGFEEDLDSKSYDPIAMHGADQGIPEFKAMYNIRSFEAILKQAKIDSVEKFVNTFFANPQVAAFLAKADEYILSDYLHFGGVESPEDLLELINSDDARAVLLNSGRNVDALYPRTAGPELRRYAIEGLQREFAAENLTVLTQLHEAGFEPEKVDRLRAVEEFTGGFLTLQLAQRIDAAEDPGAELKTWRETSDSFEQGNFDPSDVLHQDLEYVRFRREAISLERGRFQKDLTYDEFVNMIELFGQGKMTSSGHQFEMECAAYEATMLMDYVDQVHQEAKRLGRPLLVVPNMSYGGLPVAAIEKQLEARGIEVLKGIKVGSTESHENSEVMVSNLFGDKTAEIVKDQPIILVVDGTKHLVSRNFSGGEARYPDAHRGYLNETIAINYALGFNEGEYPSKDEQKMSDLEGSVGFVNEVVNIKRWYVTENGHQPYQFQFWNTAGKDLVIRDQRESVAEIPPYNPTDMTGPTMIFCNVGLLDEQIPDSISRDGVEEDHHFWHSGHVPAYFDDNEVLSAIELTCDGFGVKRGNILSALVQETFERMYAKRES
jgi:hypothetical protein